MDITRMRSAGVILAGGRSSRMGRDKTFLTWRGQTFLAHTQLILQNAGIDAVYISGLPAGANTIADVMPNLGPVGGVCSSIQKLAPHYNRLVFLSIDMPCMKPELIVDLLHQPVSFDVCFYREHFLPFLIYLNNTVINYANQHTEPASLHSFLHHLDFDELPVTDNRSFININTPEQLKEISDENTIP